MFATLPQAWLGFECLNNCRLGLENFDSGRLLAEQSFCLRRKRPAI